MARRMIDYIQADDDLMVSGGDFLTGESTYQHQRDLLLNVKGDYKATPEVCVGAADYIDDDDKSAIKREISKQFLADGMTVNDLRPNPESISNDKMKIFNNSYYE